MVAPASRTPQGEVVQCSAIGQRSGLVGVWRLWATETDVARHMRDLSETLNDRTEALRSVAVHMQIGEGLKRERGRDLLVIAVGKQNVQI